MQGYGLFPIKVKGILMATFRKVDGKWRADVARKGVRKSKRFRTKAEAMRWAVGLENILAGNNDSYWKKRL